MNPIKKGWLAVALAATVFAAGCGGGGGGDGSTPPNPGGGGSTPAKVTGPLDVVQNPLSDAVLGQLANAVAGTPLEAVVTAVDKVVIEDLLDIVDVLALGLRQAQGNPAALAGVAGDVQQQVLKLALDLRSLLGALGPGAGGGTGSGGTDPLAGTPLAPLSAALLPVLNPLISQLQSKDADDLQLSQLAALVDQLNTQLQAGLALVPADARNAPVVGGAFATLTGALTDVTSLLQAAGAYNGALTASRLETTVNNLLVNVLTKVVPLEFIETQSGRPGVLTGQIQAGVAQLAGVLGDNVGLVLTPVLEQLLAGALSPVLDPIENTVLPAVLTPIIDAISGGVGSGGGPGFLGTALGSVTSLVGGVVNGVLGQIVGGGSTPSCLFQGTPLQFLCSVLGR
jgi:hypothetical protein